MNPRSFVRCFPAAILAVSAHIAAVSAAFPAVSAAIVASVAGIGLVMADPFHAVPLDEGNGQMSYEIVDAKGSAVMVVRDRAEYSTTELRARDVAGRLNRAVENQENHG